MIGKTVADIIRKSRVIPRVVDNYQIEKIVFSFTSPRVKKHLLFGGKFGWSPVFCIVHWNAPDFLLLNVSQIEFLYPNSKIYVLDNGSQQSNIDAIEKGLRQYNNITLFAAPGYPNWATRIAADRLLYSHTKGLQFLLNYAVEKGDEFAVFLDQDCILSNRVDNLIAKLGKDVILIGPRCKGNYNLVHASFMILQPKRIYQLFGKFSIFHEQTNLPEAYHGLSLKSRGKILFLESIPHNEIPSLSSYSTEGVTYAWHAWFSSRTIGLSAITLVDGLYSVSYLQSIRKLSFEQMKKIHEETITNSVAISSG
jgi:hypothetical protein